MKNVSYSSTNTWVAVALLVCSTIENAIACGPSLPKFQKSDMKQSLFINGKISGSSINDKLEYVDNNYKAVFNVISKGSGLLSNIPVIGQIYGISSAVIDFLSSFTDLGPNADLWNEVSSIADGRIFIQKMSDMRVQMRVVDSNLRRLTSSSYTVSQKSTQVTAGFESLHLLIGYFGDADSILRKYPLHSAPVLLALTRLYQSYTEVAVLISPIIITSTQELMCNLREILQQYKLLSIYARYKLISVKISGSVDTITSWDYNAEYADNRVPNLSKHCYKINACDITNHEFVIPRGRMNYCIFDNFGAILEPKDTRPGEPGRTYWEACRRDYSREVRYLYDKKFDRVIDSVSQTGCNAERQFVQKLAYALPHILVN